MKDPEESVSAEEEDQSEVGDFATPQQQFENLVGAQSRRPSKAVARFVPTEAPSDDYDENGQTDDTTDLNDPDISPTESANEEEEESPDDEQDPDEEYSPSEGEYSDDDEDEEESPQPRRSTFKEERTPSPLPVTVKDEYLTSSTAAPTVLCPVYREEFIASGKKICIHCNQGIFAHLRKVEMLSEEEASRNYRCPPQSEFPLWRNPSDKKMMDVVEFWKQLEHAFTKFNTPNLRKIHHLRDCLRRDDRALAWVEGKIERHEP